MQTKKILSLMQRISKAYLSRCAGILEEFDLLLPSFHILMFLSNHPDSCTAKDISDLLNIKANVISVHVNRLVNEGYLTRETMSDDRRKVRLSCTQKAAAVIARGSTMEAHFCEQLKEGLTETQMCTLHDILLIIGHNADHIFDERN